MDDSDWAAAFRAQLAELPGAPEFPSWQRDSPTFKQRLSGLVATTQGTGHTAVLLDPGATCCFIGVRLAAALDLRPSGEQGPTSVAMAATGGALGLAAPALIHLGLGGAFPESMLVSPMAMDVGEHVILCKDWTSSLPVFQVGRV